VFFYFKNKLSRRNYKMAIQGAVRLDKVHAKKYGTIEHIKNLSADMQNGFVFHAEDLSAGEREVKDVIQPSTASITAKSLLLHASVETVYLAGQTLLDFYLAQGQAGRGYLLRAGDIVTVTDNVITGSTTVGQYVIPQNASFQLAAAASLAGGTKFQAKVIAKETIYGQAATVFQVLNN
jgi:hypothetical protein